MIQRCAADEQTERRSPSRADLERAPLVGCGVVVGIVGVVLTTPDTSEWLAWRQWWAIAAAVVLIGSAYLWRNARSADEP